MARKGSIKPVKIGLKRKEGLGTVDDNEFLNQLRILEFEIR